MSRPEEPRSAATGLLAVGAVVSLLLAGVGLVAGRADVALLAVPLAVAVVWTFQLRPREGRAEVDAEVPERRIAGQNLEYVVSARFPSSVETAGVQLTTLGDRTRHIVVAARGLAELRGEVPVLHSGPQLALTVDVRGFSADRAYAAGETASAQARVVIAPAVGDLRALPLPTRLQGLTGGHDSRRAGDGGDFHDISQFRPGDRLRRIDWKATARRAVRPGELYVRRTVATAEAAVILVVDSRDEVGENVAAWGRNIPSATGMTSMDLARSAAATVAASYIHAGDRVGFQDLATSGRAVPPGGGGRHLERVLQTIARTHPVGRPRPRYRPPALTSGALVMVFSTFLDEEAGRMAGLWRAIGHRVVAVDVFPLPRLDKVTAVKRAAYRIVTMEREDRIADLRARGIEVVRWQEAAESLGPAAQFRALTRTRRSR